MSILAPVIYLPHGGGPMPLLGDESHSTLINFLQTLSAQMTKPDAIIIISAHWEAPVATINSHEQPSMLFDYYGFPAQAYQFKYPAPGAPALAESIYTTLKKAGKPVMPFING